jgi:hypothetical protein
MRQDVTFLNQIDEQVEEIKRDLAYRQLVESGDDSEARDVCQISFVAGVSMQETDEEGRRPPRQITISPVKYQEPR